MKNHYGKKILNHENSEIIDCELCGFIHVNPIPSQKKFSNFYSNKFYESKYPKYIQKYESELEYWNIVYDERIDTIQKYVKNKPKKILDIGCGAGFFLARALHYGWNVLGVEPSKTASNYAREKGIPIIEEFFETIDFENNKFDCIHMNAVLEHTINPISFIQKSYNLLTDDGFLIIDVPNDFNPLQKVVTTTFGKKEWWIEPNEHINYFNFKSLTSLVENNRFKVLRKESTFPLELFLLFGHDYIENDKVGQQIHSERMNLEIYMKKSGKNELKRQLYSKFAELGIGRRAVIYARKITKK